MRRINCKIEMEFDDGEIINVRKFLEKRIGLVREDYFSRNKNIRELLKNDLTLPDAAFIKLEEMCK